MSSAHPTVEDLGGRIADSAGTESFIPTSAQVRTWGTKSFVSLIDQALTSAAGFAATVLLARWMPVSGYGAFAVAFTGYLFLTTFHNALLLEPLSVIGPARHAANLRSYFRAQLRVHGLLVWPLTGAALAAAWILSRLTPHSPLIGALIGGGLSLPVLLLLWLTRRMCYVLQCPAIAVGGSGIYFTISVGILFALHYFDSLTPLTAFFALGLGSLLGAILIFRRVNFATESSEETTPWRVALRENWNYGRWLVGSALFYSVSTTTQMFFVAGAIGLGAAGVLRAMQIPSMVMTQTMIAINLLVLPALSYDFGRGLYRHLRRKAVLISLVLGFAAICFAGFLALADARIEHIFYNGKYAEYARLIPILALMPVANSFCTGYSMALRASQKPYCDLVSNALSAVVAVLSTIVFVREWGLLGAAVSMVLSFVVMNLVTLIFFAFLGKDRRPQPMAIVVNATEMEL
jgi:O-antigen/teichoic acid export membrane protein